MIIHRITLFSLLLYCCCCSNPAAAANVYLYNVPYRSGITNYDLDNVLLTRYNGSNVAALCHSTIVQKSDQVLAFEAANPTQTYLHALYIKLVVGCYPDVISRVVADSNFSIVIVGDRVNPIGSGATSIWRYGQKFAIPVVQVDTNDVETITNETVLHLVPSDSYYQSSKFLGYAIALDVVFGILCAVQVVLSVDRLYYHLKATGLMLTTSVQVLIMEFLEGITKLTMGVLDPFGYFHILPTPWWRMVVFIGSSVTILTTFMLAFRMHAAIREAGNRPRLTWWKYFLIFLIPLGMLVADFVGALKYSTLEDGLGVYALFSAILYTTSMTVTGSYFAYTKFSVLRQLTSSLLKNDKRGLRRMGYFLTVSGGSMVLTIITTLLYAIGLTRLKDGDLLFVLTTLSAIFITLTGIFHILALRRYSHKKLDDQDSNNNTGTARPTNGKHFRQMSSVAKSQSDKTMEVVQTRGSVVTTDTDNQKI